LSVRESGQQKQDKREKLLTNHFQRGRTVSRRRRKRKSC